MKITIESTTAIVEANGVKCRVWEGQSERGVKVTVLVPLIAVKNEADATEFEADLQERVPPSPEVARLFPTRMTL